MQWVDFLLSEGMQWGFTVESTVIVRVENWIEFMLDDCVFHMNRSYVGGGWSTGSAELKKMQGNVAFGCLMLKNTISYHFWRGCWQWTLRLSAGKVVPFVRGSRSGIINSR